MARWPISIWRGKPIAITNRTEYYTRSVRRRRRRISQRALRWSRPLPDDRRSDYTSVCRGHERRGAGGRDASRYVRRSFASTIARTRERARARAAVDAESRSRRPLPDPISISQSSHRVARGSLPVLAELQALLSELLILVVVRSRPHTCACTAAGTRPSDTGSCTGASSCVAAPVAGSWRVC